MVYPVIMSSTTSSTGILKRRNGFTDMAEEYGAEQVIYAHCHCQNQFHDSI